MNMTPGKKKLLHSRRSARHFLFSKTDTGRLKEISRRKTGDANQVLQSTYPEMLRDARFINHALQRLESAAQFAAMAIRLDPPPPEDENPAGSTGMGEPTEVVEILEAVGREENGIYFR